MTLHFARDPFARTERVRQAVGYGDCRWCGRVRRVYRYGTCPDGLRERHEFSPGRFCSYQCYRTYSP